MLLELKGVGGVGGARATNLGTGVITAAAATGKMIQDKSTAEEEEGQSPDLEK